MSPTDNLHGFDFEALAREHYQPLYRFAYSMVKNEADAADLTQQTFLIFADKGGSVRERSKIKSWLFTTLYREFLRLRRRGDFSVAMEPEILEATTEPVHERIPERIDAHTAVEALQQVDEAYRAPLSLFYMEDLSYKEIAAALDIPIGTVMSRLSRGKAQLKRYLSKTREISA